MAFARAAAPATTRPFPSIPPHPFHLILSLSHPQGIDVSPIGIGIEPIGLDIQPQGLDVEPVR